MTSSSPSVRGLLNAKTSTGFSFNNWDCGRSKVTTMLSWSSSSDTSTRGEKTCKHDKNNKISLFIKKKQKRVVDCKRRYLQPDPKPPRLFGRSFVFLRWVLTGPIGMNCRIHCRSQTKPGCWLEVHHLSPWRHGELPPSRPQSRGHPDALQKLEYGGIKSEELQNKQARYGHMPPRITAWPGTARPKLLQSRINKNMFHCRCEHLCGQTSLSCLLVWVNLWRMGVTSSHLFLLTNTGVGHWNDFKKQTKKRQLMCPWNVHRSERQKADWGGLLNTFNFEKSEQK